MNVKPLSTLQRVLTAGLARARLECASSAACPRLLLITLKFLHVICQPHGQVVEISVRPMGPASVSLLGWPPACICTKRTFKIEMTRARLALADVSDIILDILVLDGAIIF